MTWIDTGTPENGLADLAIRAVRDTFGEAVSYTPASTGVPESIVAPFDDLPVDLTLQGLSVEDSASGPKLDVRVADLSVAPARGDTCTIRGVDFEVVEAEPSSRGCCKLYLHRVP